MTTEKQVVPWKQAIAAAKPKFMQIASKEHALLYDKESMFAMQAIVKNNMVLKAALENPVSVRNAVINVAAVGLSLNPATRLAYLVPRDNEVCLDISYMGLIKIATDTGSILWAKADIVYENDTFIYRGPSEKPDHQADVFSADRGAKVGVYCIAKTIDNEYLVETMSASEILDIRSKSKGADSKYSPWVNFEGEMWKKAVIKRASKTWPKTDRSGRLDEAVNVINEGEGLIDAYIEHSTNNVEGTAVDLMMIEDKAHIIRELIDDPENDEENLPAILAEIDGGLSNDERIALAEKLKLTKPEGMRKTHVSLYNEYLRINDKRLKDMENPEINNANYAEVM